MRARLANRRADPENPGVTRPPIRVVRPVRAELPELPSRITRLPVDDRGYPVPWFGEWFDQGKGSD
jgi:hypothetical protein